MIRLTVLYGTPADEAKFLEHYENVHVPLAKTMPGLTRMTWGRCLPGPDGSAPPYFLNAELCWDGPDELQRAFGSEEGQATTADLANLPAESVTMLVSEGH